MKYHTAMERAERGRPTCPGCLRGESDDKELHYNVDTWSICVVSKASTSVASTRHAEMLFVYLLCYNYDQCALSLSKLSDLEKKSPQCSDSVYMCLCCIYVGNNVCGPLQPVHWAKAEWRFPLFTTCVSEFHLTKRCISVSGFRIFPGKESQLIEENPPCKSPNGISKIKPLY